jgi:16S rRNA pseudouridine516 synthase
VARLDYLLSRNLACSRTAAARLIKTGRVRDESGQLLEGRRLELEAARLPFTVIIAGDGEDDDSEGADGDSKDGDSEGGDSEGGERRVALYDAVHLMLNKPLGVVTALRDERHPTAFELVQDAPLAGELRAVGRLDLDTSGLLLWTTDGQWVQRLTHPKRHIPRTYQAALARAFGALPAGFALEDGHRPTVTALDVIERGALHPSLVVPAETTVFAQITVVGGAYHEVRRIFAALGSHVLGLCRTAFGRLALPRDLPPSTYVDVDLSLV